MDNSPIRTFNQVWEYNDYLGLPTPHKQVCVIDLSQLKPTRHERYMFGFYILFLKEVKCGELLYGRQTYDYQEGTVVAVAPGQTVGTADTGEVYQPKGWALAFHPDLIHGTPLGRAMKEYSYFSYESNEALHLSEDERNIVIACLQKIKAETEAPADRHTRKIINVNIETLLDYCLRFYERQFVTRAPVNHDFLIRFENLLEEYYASEKARKDGLPTVKYFADKLCLSSNYFGDLVKKETGRTAREHIQQKLIDVAKERVLDPAQNISSVAYELGFQYPQHFTRLFKKVTGYTPQQYRQGS
ncbi:MAG: helix-turn-helix domain-containing protein [Bacteroidales bacterium]|nr:helix-turn-helix domain-containing protein [Bacteroidales bacterium]